MTEMEQLEQNDAVVAFAMAMHKDGVVPVMASLRHNYPQLYKRMYEELVGVKTPAKAVLLRKPDAPSL